MSTRYTVLMGLNYKTRKGEVRAEPGDTVDDLPPKSTAWLLDRGAIAPAPDDESRGD